MDQGKRIVRITWNKVGEEVGSREIVFQLEVPVRRETSELEDAILRLPARGPFWGGSEKAKEIPGEDYESTWVIPAGELVQAPDLAAVLVLIQGEPARRQAVAAEIRAKREAEEMERFARQLAELEEFLSVPPKERVGRSTYPISVYLPEGLPAELAARAGAYREECRKVAEGNEAREREVREAKDRAKEGKARARRQYIAIWAAEHGSARLRAQMEAGLDGWPLYLHERLAADLGPGVALDNDGLDPEPLINPTFEQMNVAAQLATDLKRCGQVPEGQPAITAVTVCSIRFEPEEDDGFGAPEPEERIYACATWCPGPSSLFDARQVRSLIE